jgi:NAD+ kinase
MKVALYGRTFSAESVQSIKILIEKICHFKAELYIYLEFAAFLQETGIGLPENHYIFTDRNSLPEETKFLFSFGGDGTFLQTVNIVGDSGIPVIGINAGRLGFLAGLSIENLGESLEALFNGIFTIEERTLIELAVHGVSFSEPPVALNEITIHKEDMGMITIHAELDGEFLNSYWADGLIISTPTGSTAYSMSVGGPIILPDSENLIISPVSPHTLTVRPLVIPDTKVIRLKVSSRSENFLIALDSRSLSVHTGSELIIKKADYTLKLVRIHGSNFYNTLRNKLMWGIDKRN